MKKMSKKFDEEPELARERRNNFLHLKKELNLLMIMDHPNVVKVEDSFEDKTSQ